MLRCTRHSWPAELQVTKQEPALLWSFSHDLCSEEKCSMCMLRRESWRGLAVPEFPQSYGHVLPVSLPLSSLHTYPSRYSALFCMVIVIYHKPGLPLRWVVQHFLLYLWLTAHSLLPCSSTHISVMTGSENHGTDPSVNYFKGKR